MGEENKQYQGNLGLVGDFLNMGYDAWQSAEARKFASEEAQKNRDFQSEMYNRQLSDSIDWRTHQEIYNSPSAQMQRFVDAGINPMFMVTGANGGTSVHTPSLTGGFGSTAATPGYSTGRINVAEAIRLKNESRIARGQEKLLEAEARKANADAQEIEYKQPRGEYFRDVWNTFKNIHTTDGWSMAQDEAHFMSQARQYDWDFQDMSFEDAKLTFEHSKEVRAFARDLQGHQRSLFEHELSQAKSAASTFAVAAKWAVANQWINAGSQVLGAATGLARAFNVPTTTVQKTITSYDNSERHIYGDYQYKPQRTTINDPNW